jgi:glutathione S-transferase
MTTPFKLYYTPTSCGAANFLAATIGGLAFDSETVDLKTHKTKSGADFYTINPKGNVPTIVFPDGTRLNENVATLTYLADKGNAGLAPKEGSHERYAYLNDIGFVASELHPAYGALFNPAVHDDIYEEGLRRRPWTQVYTSRGVGTVHLQVRFLCRPEVALIELTRAPRPRTGM